MAVHRLKAFTQGMRATMTDISTRVHAIETTGELKRPPSYRTFRAMSCQEELTATEELYARMDDSEGTDRIKSLSECRKFAWFARNVETNYVHVVSNSCRLRWCPLCSSGRTGYIIQNLTPWMKKIKVPRFMTLTMKHSAESLSEQIRVLYSHFRTLRKHKWFKKYVCGGVWFFQVSLSKRSDEWHPHLHCVLQGKYIPKGELSKRWEQITNGSKIVDLKLVRDPNETAKYVARYSARPAQLMNYPLELRVEIFVAMHRRRLAGTWGTARGVSLSPPTSVESEKYVKVGTWATVTYMEKEDEAAKQILDAWRNHLPLEPSVSVKSFDDFIDDAPFSKPNESDEYCQLHLDFL